MTAPKTETPSYSSEFEVRSEGACLGDAFGREYVHAGSNSEEFTDPIGGLDVFTLMRDPESARLTLKRLREGCRDYFKRNMQIHPHRMRVAESTGDNDEERIVNLEYRRDLPFGLFTSIISDKRAQKDPDMPCVHPATGAGLLEERIKICRFEPHNSNQTPLPRIMHPELTIDGYVPVTVPNKFSFGVESVVNCYTSHSKMDPSKLQGEDLRNFVEISRKEALRLRAAGYNQMFCFINVGEDAGGSIEHPHSQDGAIPEIAGSVKVNELSRYLKWQKYNSDPFPVFFEYVRDSPYYCFENDSTIVMTPFAPRLPDQVDIYLKRRFENLSRLDPQRVWEVADSLASAINFYTTRKSISDFNVICHQSDLGDTESSYRMHFHLLPRAKLKNGQRKTKYDAGLELGSGVYVVDIYPEDTAKEFREWKFGKPQTAAV